MEEKDKREKDDQRFIRIRKNEKISPIDVDIGNDITQNGETTRFKNRKRKRWKNIISVLCAGMVFCTSYSLILPAITLSNEVYCGIAEHTHTEKCYITDQLLCGLDESEGHNHTLDCYEKQLVCTNTDEDHVHDESCYEDVLVCGLTAGEGHIHTDDCYLSSNLQCQKTEHVHTLQCYSNPDADVEDADERKESVPDSDELSDNLQERILQVAKSQLHYTESSDNYQVIDENTETVSGYTRYGDMFSDPYGDWSSYFIDFVLRYSNLSPISIPAADEVELLEWIEKEENARVISEASEIQYQSSDLVFLKSKSDGKIYVGIVDVSNIPDSQSIDLDDLHLIVGDIDDGVYEICLDGNHVTNDSDKASSIAFEILGIYRFGGWDDSAVNTDEESEHSEGSASDSAIDLEEETDAVTEVEPNQDDSIENADDGSTLKDSANGLDDQETPKDKSNLNENLKDELNDEDIDQIQDVADASSSAPDEDQNIKTDSDQEGQVSTDNPESSEISGSRDKQEDLDKEADDEAKDVDTDAESKSESEPDKEKEEETELEPYKSKADEADTDADESDADEEDEVTEDVNSEDTSTEGESESKVSEETESSDSEIEELRLEEGETDPDAASSSSKLTLIAVDEQGREISGSMEVLSVVDLTTSPLGDTLQVTRTVDDTQASYEVELEYAGAYFNDEKVAEVSPESIVLEEADTNNENTSLIGIYTGTSQDSGDQDADKDTLELIGDAVVYLTYAANSEKKTYVYENNDFKVTATASDENVFPDEAEFVVTELTEETEGYNYEAYRGAAINAGAGEDMLLLDLAFYMPDAENPDQKVELQPENGYVTFEIEPKSEILQQTFGDDASWDSVSIYHLPVKKDAKQETTAKTTDIEEEDIDSETVDVQVSGDNAVFTLDSLSVVTVAAPRDSNYYFNASDYYPDSGKEYFDSDLVGGQYSLDYLLTGYSYITFDDLTLWNHTIGSILVKDYLIGINGNTFADGILDSQYRRYTVDGQQITDESLVEGIIRPSYIGKIYTYNGNEFDGSHSKMLPLYLGTENQIRFQNNCYGIYRYTTGTIDGSGKYTGSNPGWKDYWTRSRTSKICLTDNFIRWNDLMSVVTSASLDLKNSSSTTISYRNGKIVVDGTGASFNEAEGALYIYAGSNVTIRDAEVLKYLSDLGSGSPRIYISFHDNSSTTKANNNLDILLTGNGTVDETVINLTFSSENELNMPRMGICNRYTDANGNEVVIKWEDPTTGNMSFNGTTINGTSIIWNFTGKNNITLLDSFAWMGHILAPNSTIKKMGGQHSGCWIAQSIESNSEAHFFPYPKEDGYILPATGGSGTRIFTATGSVILAAGSLFGYLDHKKKKQQKFGGDR